MPELKMHVMKECHLGSEKETTHWCRAAAAMERRWRRFGGSCSVEQLVMSSRRALSSVFSAFEGVFSLVSSFCIYFASRS